MNKVIIDWNDDMASAPRDGTVIFVGWKFPEDIKMQEYFPMRWGHIQKNNMFPNVVGMWVCPNGNFTWNEDDPDGAPTHWAHIPDHTKELSQQ